MSFKDLLDCCQSEALANKFEPTEEAIWRQICRTYSKNFHTPLDQVERLDPYEVVLHYYENQMADVNLDDKIDTLMDVIYSIEDPNYVNEKEKETEEFLEAAEEEEAERIAEGRPIHPALKGEATLKPVLKEPKKELPKEGFVDFSSLEELEKESGGFNDEPV